MYAANIQALNDPGRVELLLVNQIRINVYCVCITLFMFHFLLYFVLNSSR